MKIDEKRRILKKKELKELDKKDILNKKDIVENGFIKNYLDYIEYHNHNNWIRESITLNELLSRIVTINNLKAGDEGIIIDILCPAGRIIAIPGIKSFPKDYQIDKIPPFEVKFSNPNGEEISPDTNIKILKNKVLKKSEEICDILYRDLSFLNYTESPNKFKHFADLFRFEQGIELKGEDHLKVQVINPDKDIEVVKFNLGIDLLTPME